MSSGAPFSPRRRRDDVVNTLPALGMVLGGTLGALVGLLRGVGGPVSLGGAGIAVGLVLGLLVRAFLSRPES
ncbi:MAG TPA: hypothetical protein VFV40_00710 [Nocardioides sp.]|nr:hypothetical protein [Nocardioides sp.]